MSLLLLDERACNVQDSARTVGDALSVPDGVNDCLQLLPNWSQSDRSRDVAGRVGQVARKNDLLSDEKPPVDSHTCPTCREYVKTKSEMNHHLRHTKTFYCNNVGCTRKEEFSAENETLRHVRSRHPDASPEIPNKSQYQIAGSKSKDKKWPRLDNFRSHLQHEEMGEAVELTSQPLGMELLHASNVAEMRLHEESQHSDILPESQCIEPITVSQRLHFLNRLLKNVDPISVSRNSLSTVPHGGGSSTKSDEGSVNILEKGDSLLRRGLKACLEEGRPSNKPDEDQALRLLQIIKDAGYRLRDEGPERGREHVRMTRVNVKGLVSCDKCPFAGRPCELKKHMKRHSRPYGCTFPKCQKTFGSKNDWKRHETSQHHQLETWCCDQDLNGHICNEMFVSADVFRLHLEKIHHLSDQVVDSKIAGPRRRGLISQVHFWCASCAKIVELHQAGVDAWTERFNHIDDHFMGRNGTNQRSISEWLPPGSGTDNKTRISSREPIQSQSRRNPPRFPEISSSVTSFFMSDCTGQTISEAGIGWDGLDHSETSVYYNMYSMINGQEEEGVAKLQQAHSSRRRGSFQEVVVRIQEVVVRKLMSELPSVFNKEWAAKIEMYDGNRSPIPRDSAREKRSTESPDELYKEDIKVRAPKRIKTDYARAAEDNFGLRLACPFRKHDPRKYTIYSHRSCALSFWDSVARVKEHIYRRHRQPTQCMRCWKLVKDQDELDAHLRVDDICKIQPGEPADGLSVRDVARMGSRKKAPPDQSEEERWREIHGILFPREPVPTHTFDQVHDDIASSPGSSDLAYYEEYSRRELPKFFRRWLEVAATKETRIDYLRRDLIAMVRKFQDRAFSAWEPKKAPLNLTHGRFDESVNPELSPGQATMNYPQAESSNDNLQARTTDFHPASFELIGPERDDTHSLHESGFPSVLVKPNSLLDGGKMETPQISCYCLDPCICENGSKENPTMEQTDPSGQLHEDLPNEDWRFGTFDLPTSSDFLESDVDWEAIFMDMPYAAKLS